MHSDVFRLYSEIIELIEKPMVPEGNLSTNVEGEEFEEIKGESETIAGLLLEIKGGFPKKGEIIKLQNYVLTVEHMDEKRIHRIKLEVK